MEGKSFSLSLYSAKAFKLSGCKTLSAATRERLMATRLTSANGGGGQYYATTSTGRRRRRRASERTTATTASDQDRRGFLFNGRDPFRFDDDEGDDDGGVAKGQERRAGDAHICLRASFPREGRDQPLLRSSQVSASSFAKPFFFFFSQ